MRELLSSVIQHQARLGVLDLSDMKNLVALPSSFCKLKGLVKLDVSYCSKLESLPEEIGDLEKLEKLLSRHTLISRPPSSIICLNKLKFLTFARLMHVTMTTQLIPLCYDVKSWMALKLELFEPDSNCLIREYSPDSVIHFFLLPFAGLWDASKANGKTSNDYGRIMFSFSGDIRGYGFRLLYKYLHIGTRKSRDDDSVTNEASCSSSKKQRSHFLNPGKGPTTRVYCKQPYLVFLLEAVSNIQKHCNSFPRAQEFRISLMADVNINNEFHLLILHLCLCMD